MTTLADHLHQEACLDTLDHDEQFHALNLTRAEWRQIYKALSVQEQWESRCFPFLKEKVPMAGATRLLDLHTQALANMFRPDVPKAKKALTELAARALVQLNMLGD